jgi:hypothetical protein
VVAAEKTESPVPDRKLPRGKGFRKVHSMGTMATHPKLLLEGISTSQASSHLSSHPIRK